MLAPRRPVQHVPGQYRQRDHGDATIGHLRAAEIKGLAKPVKEGGLLFNIRRPDGFGMRIPQLERGEDTERAERDDERRQADVGHQRAVEGAHRRADGHRNGYGYSGRNARIDRQLAHHNHAQYQDGAHRKIDASGQDDHRLRNGDNADDSDLLEHQRQRAGIEEILGNCAEYQHADDEKRCGNGRRIAAQKAAHPMHEGFVVLLKRYDRSVSLVECRFEIRDCFGRSGLVAHAFAPVFACPAPAPRPVAGVS